jgi:abortive infection bacteriophage resistance protein
MVAEIMPFGTMLTLFDGAEPAIKRAIAAEYGVPDVVFHSWLGTLNVVRNICAHHGRLWNRQLGFRPKFPNARKYPEWHTPVAIPNDRVFAILTILKYMLVYAAPQSQWPCRLRALLDASPDVPQYQMGFPPNWESSTLWKS